MANKIKVMIIDDSALVRKVLSELLEDSQGIEVIDTARDPLDAIKKIKKEKPDVISLDLQMPRMDGLTFLKKLMSVHPIPVIVISSLTREGSKETIKALDLGAIDFVAKPTVGISSGLEELKKEIVKKIKHAARVKMSNVKKLSKKKQLENKSDNRPQKVNVDSTIEVIAIGASTGGTVAVRNVLQNLPSNMPGIIAVLHMPETFTGSYAESLNKSCQLKVKEAEDEEEFNSGTVYVAPGNKHLTLQQGVSGYFFQTDEQPKINHVRPAIDKTFLSIADIVAPNCIGVILTGMGHDGARGLKKMYDRGSLTIAQDKETSVVSGMPTAAVQEGGVSKVLPLDQISLTLTEIISK